MAQLTITVPDAVVARIRTALGRRDPLTSVWVDATQQEVLDRIKGFLKSQVIEHEVALDALQSRATKSQEGW